MFVTFARRLHREESGFAMIVGIVLSSVIATLAVTMLTVGSHSDKATARGRHWVQALHVAESGVERAIATIEENGGRYSGSFTGTTEEGQYSVTVTQGSRNVFTVDSTGSVRAGAQLNAERSLRVTLEPPRMFEEALFSFTTVETKNGDTVEGDIWANQNIILADNTHVTGSLVAATGYVKLSNGADVDEDVWSGGFDSSTNYAVHVPNNARVDGDAKASVTAPQTANPCDGVSNANYKVRVDGAIGGSVTTWGQVEGGGSTGPVSNNTCTSAPATKEMPVYTYTSTSYDPATLHEYGTPSAPVSDAISQFQAYVNAQTEKRIQGTFVVFQSGTVSQSNRVDLTGVKIVGDTTIITNAPVFTNNTTDDTSDAIFAVISTYQPPTGTSCDVNQDSSECAVHLKNNFSVSGNTAVLIYTPYGPAAVKNNAVQFGVIYGDSVQVKNNQTMTYDARVDRIVGFGDVTLEITRWEEV